MAPSSSFLKRVSTLFLLIALFGAAVFAEEIPEDNSPEALRKQIKDLQEKLKNPKKYEEEQREAEQAKSKAEALAIIDAEALVKVAKKYNNAPLGHDRVKKYAKYYRHFQSEFDVETNGKKELLCSTMLSLTPENIESVLPSIEHSDNKCDWLIIIYKVPVDDETNLDKDGLVASFDAQLAPVLENLKKKLPEGREETKVTLEFAVPRETLLTGMVDRCEQYIKRDVSALIEASVDEKEKKFLSTFNPCDLSDFKLMNGQNVEEAKKVKYNHIIYPKISLFYSYLPYLSKYNHIWALDGDLSLEHVNMNEFANSLRCSFKNTPLVLQPLIADNTQPYTYLNANTWSFVNDKERQNNKRSIHTAVTGFIEIQTPIFNTYFLEFYIMSFLTPMIQPTHILGADWGFDETFCKAAKFFAKTSLYQEYVPNSIDSSIPCALLVSTSIHHKNSQEVNGALGSSNKFTLSNELVRMVTAAFNAFSQGGNNVASNPVDSAKDYLRIYSFQEECMAKHGYADEHADEEEDVNDEL